MKPVFRLPFGRGYWLRLFFLSVYVFGLVGVVVNGNVLDDVTLSVLGVPYSVNPLGIMVYAVFGYWLVPRYDWRSLPVFSFAIGFTELQYNAVHFLFQPSSFYPTIDSPNWGFFLALWVMMAAFGLRFARLGTTAYAPWLEFAAVFLIMVFLTYGGFFFQVVSGLATLSLLYWGFEPRRG